MSGLTKIKSISNRFKNFILATAFVLTQFVVPASSLFAGTAAAAGDICAVDTAGANDEPGQKDLTKLCVNYDNVPTTVSTTFNWDETGTSGANTMDACNLFDTDGDGNINYAVCLTTKNDPAELQFFKTYSCGDDKIDRCTSPATEISSGSTACTVTQVTNDPFVNGTSSPKDTQGACTVQLSTVGGASAKLIDVCSFPSNQPNSDPSDCVIARPNAAKLEVVKQLDPESDPGRFDLKINGTTYASNVGDGGTTGTQVVTVDNQHPTQTVLEQANSTTNSTSLSNYTTTVVCKDLHGTGQVVGSSSPTGATTRQLTVTIAAESDVVCTFTNTRATGHITVTKVVENNHGGQATASQFPLYVGDTSVTSGVSNSFTANQQYTVSESGGPSGYTQKSLSCLNDSQQEVGATFTLGADENISCTITNEDIAPTLTLVKHVSGGTATATDWTLSATPSAGQTLSGAGGFTDQDAMANTEYTLGESGGPSGYTASNWSCDGGTLVGSKLTLALADDVTCEITNTRDTGTLTINKVINPSNDGGLFDLTMTGPTNFTAYDQSNGGTTGARIVDTGSYTVSEAAGTNTILGDYSSQYVCYDGETQVASGSAISSTAFNVQKDHNVVCTFTNTRFGSISGFKAIVNADGSPTGNDASGWTIFLDSNNNGQLDNGELSYTTGGDGAYLFDHLLPGDYNIVEVLTNGWTQIYGPTNPLSLTAGENSTENNFGNYAHGNITVNKEVVNDNGGTAVASDFTLKVNDDEVTSGATNEYAANTEYTVSESDPSSQGYEQTNLVCTNDSEESLGATFTLAPGENVTCTITNDDIAPKLTVYKFVDNNGTNLTKTSADFTMNVTGTNVSDNSFAGSDSGVEVTLDAGNYSVSEDDDSDYTASYSDDCTGTINVGDTKTCTVWNTANRNPAIHVEKDGPSSAYAGNKVTYTFTVTNPGNVSLDGVTVSDDVAGDGAVLKSGDVNSNDMLDPGETWIYTVDYTIPAGQKGDVVNTVTACGMEEQQREEAFQIESFVQDGVAQKVCDTDTHTTRILHVLGSSTELPNTGQNPLTYVVAGFMLIGLAAAVRLFGRKPQGSTL